MTDHKDLIKRLRDIDDDMNDDYGGGKGPSLFREAADTLESATAEHCAVVKPLEWVPRWNGKDGTAETELGTYSVGNIHGTWTWFLSTIRDEHDEIIKGVGAKNTEKSTRAAAQADYERRIIASLNGIRPASEVAAEAQAATIEAVYERMFPKNDPSDWTDFAKDRAGLAVQLRDALHTDETRAVLERIRAEAVQAERERCAKVAASFGCCHVPDEIAAAIKEGE